VAQTGWLVNSNKNKVRYLDSYKEATRPVPNHPVCAAKERDLLLRRSRPSLKTEGSELASTAVIDFELAWLGKSLGNLLPLLYRGFHPWLQFIHTLAEEGKSCVEA